MSNISDKLPLEAAPKGPGKVLWEIKIWDSSGGTTETFFLKAGARGDAMEKAWEKYCEQRVVQLREELRRRMAENAIKVSCEARYPEEI